MINLTVSGEKFSEVQATCREVGGGGADGTIEITLTQAVEAIWEAMGTPRPFSVDAAKRELQFTTNQGGIPQSQVVKF